jgi:hypothetical protein
MPRRPGPGPGRPKKPVAEKHLPNAFKFHPEIDGLLTTLADTAFKGNRAAAAAHAIRLAAAGLEPTYRTTDGHRRRPRSPDLTPPRRR